MKRTGIFVGLALVSACLAAGGVSWSFAQQEPPDQVPVPPQTSGQPAPVSGGTSAKQPLTDPLRVQGSFSMPAQTQLPPSNSQVLPSPSASPSPSQAPVPATSGQMPDQTFSPPPGKPAQPTTMGPHEQPAHVDVSAEANIEGPTGRQEPSVSIEWVGPTTARLHQPTIYQIIAKNISNTAVQNVVVRHRMPPGVRITGSDPRATSDGNVLTWDLGTIAPGQEKRIDLQIVPESKATLNCQATVTFTASSSLKVQVREPKLVLKTNTPERVVLGDAATLSLTVSNTGDGTADHVKIKAQLPEGLEHMRGKTIEVELGNLGAGERRTVQLICGTKSTGVQNVDCVAVADAGLTSQELAKLEVVLPRLDLNIAGPKLRYLDRHATYVLKVTNPGSAPASNVSIVHQLPQGFKFHQASNGGHHDFTTRNVTWFIGDLTPGESREVQLEVVPVTVGEFKHTACATGARGLKTESELVTRVEGLSALLMELVDSDDPVEVGAETTYEIRVTNTGSKVETNLELVCSIPEKMEFRGAKSGTGCRFRVEGKDVIFEPLPRLAPRADAIYRVVVRGMAPGDMRFRARIRADGLSEPVLREESTKVYGD